MKSVTHVLLEADDRSIADFVEPELERLDFSVRCAHDGVSGLEEVKRFGSELIVLDIIVTARDVTMDKVHSLELDADDYVTRPFEMPELPARIRALLRHVEGEEILRVADLEVHTATREVRRVARTIKARSETAAEKPNLIRTARWVGYTLKGA